jgi:hypothetical protein
MINIAVSTGQRVHIISTGVLPTCSSSPRIYLQVTIWEAEKSEVEWSPTDILVRAIVGNTLAGAESQPSQ